MDIELIIVIAHIVGTIIGVGGATMIEAHLAQTLRDKLVSSDERAILEIDYRMVRIGLVVCIVSGVAFLLIDKFEGHTQYLYSPRLWAKIVMVLAIAANTLLLQAHAINLYWGSAISFVSWWTAALIGVFISNSIHINFFGTQSFITEFTSLMLIFVVSVIAGAVVLNAFRNKISSTI